MNSGDRFNVTADRKFSINPCLALTAFNRPFLCLFVASATIARAHATSSHAKHFRRTAPPLRDR